MVSKESVNKQLKKLNFNPIGWGRGEVQELHHILLPDEQIYELANGIYEGGFALLVSTDIRVLLVDKKPLNYLNVEDLRFDMINEIDYSHRLMGAYISIATGNKDLKFRSYNQYRLRKLIGHVQDCMAEVKRTQSTRQEGQVQHLERINEQLQKYLMAQQEYQQKLQSGSAPDDDKAREPAKAEPPKPSPELADFLYAQQLMAQYNQAQTQAQAQPAAQLHAAKPAKTKKPESKSQLEELYAEGVREVFGKHGQEDQPLVETAAPMPEVSAINIAYSKLPMALRNRKFGRPSFHAYSGSRGDEPKPEATY
jgi:hypothetical protein